MIPIILGAAAATVGGIHWWKSRKAKQTQSMTVHGPNGTVSVIHAPGNANGSVVVVANGNSAPLSITDILGVQKALNTLGYTPRLTEDGKAGPATISQIKVFQMKSGLPTTGIIDPQVVNDISLTLKALASPNSAIGTSPIVTSAVQNPPDLSTCQAVQHALNILGANPKLVEDGNCGPASMSAIKTFQTLHGLVADGIAGPQTKTALSIALQGNTNN
jgi:peptidoglycan hydrolase-like protein with peptidoglycan-binding domain